MSEPRAMREIHEIQEKIHINRLLRHLSAKQEADEANNIAREKIKQFRIKCKIYSKKD